MGHTIIPFFSDRFFSCCVFVKTNDLSTKLKTGLGSFYVVYTFVNYRERGGGGRIQLK